MLWGTLPCLGQATGGYVRTVSRGLADVADDSALDGDRVLLADHSESLAAHGEPGLDVDISDEAHDEPPDVAEVHATGGIASAADVEPRGVQDPYYSRRKAVPLSARLVSPAAPMTQVDVYQGAARAAMHVQDNDTEAHEGYGGGDAHTCHDGSCQTCYDGSCRGCRPTLLGGLFGGAFCEDLFSEVHSHHRFWASFDYLSWWGRETGLPPLVTTSPPGTPQPAAGVLGQPGTEILYGGTDALDGQRNGGRLQLGFWVVDGQFMAIEGDYFQLENEREQFSAASNFSGGSAGQILGRPFFNVELGAQDAQLVAFPDFVTALGQTIDLDGAISVDVDSDVQSAGAGLRHLLWADFHHNYRVFLSGGYRFFRLDESLQISDTTFPVGGPFAPGSRIDSVDLFRTKNEFHGGDVGLLTEFRRGCWSLEVLTKIALGNNHQVLRISGATAAFDGTTTAVTPGALLTQSSNIGTFRRDEFAIIPQLNANLSYQLTQNLRARVGYTFIYWFDVARPADQVDLNVDLGQTTPQPTVPFRETDFWLQGINAGLELRF